MRKNFVSISLRSENDGIFCFISLRSENDGNFLLPFCFISLRTKNDSNFSLIFRFVFASSHFCFDSDFFVSHRCEISEKSTFFRIEAKKISLPFRFEAKMTAHLNPGSGFAFWSGYVTYVKTGSGSEQNYFGFITILITINLNIYRSIKPVVTVSISIFFYPSPSVIY